VAAEAVEVAAEAVSAEAVVEGARRPRRREKLERRERRRRRRRERRERGRGGRISRSALSMNAGRTKKAKGACSGSAYKKRYFIITVDKRLSYYDEPECYYQNRRSGTLSCVGMQCTSIDGTETIQGKESFTFTIYAKEEGDRIRRCACETIEECDKLVATIEHISGVLVLQNERHSLPATDVK
jgi:hypothetical protein